MDEAITQARQLAEHLGMQLVESNDARKGRYRIQRGRDFLHLADDIEDARGFLDSWAAYVH
jgi:hypothetical protein